MVRTGRQILVMLAAAGVAFAAAGRVPRMALAESAPPDEPNKAVPPSGKSGDAQGSGPRTQQPAGPRQGPFRFGHRGHAVPPERVDEGMAFLKQYWPERHAILDQLRSNDPQAFAAAVRTFWPHLVRIMELTQRNPELGEVEVAMVKLEFEIHSVLRPYGRAVEKGNTTEVESRLKELIAQRFDLDLRRTELRIQELEDRLNQQRQQLQARRQDKAAQVERAMREMIDSPQSGPKGGWRQGAPPMSSHEDPSSGPWPKRGKEGRGASDMKAKGQTPETQPAGR